MNSPRPRPPRPSPAPARSGRRSLRLGRAPAPSRRPRRLESGHGGRRDRDGLVLGRSRAAHRTVTLAGGPVAITASPSSGWAPPFLRRQPPAPGRSRAGRTGPPGRRVSARNAMSSSAAPTPAAPAPTGWMARRRTASARPCNHSGSGCAPTHPSILSWRPPPERPYPHAAPRFDRLASARHRARPTLRAAPLRGAERRAGARSAASTVQ